MLKQDKIIFFKSKKSKLIIWLAFLIIALGGLFIYLPYMHAPKERLSWVKAEGQRLVKEDGTVFRFIGANAVNIVFYSAWDLDIEKAVRTAKEQNISVLRIFMDWGWAKDNDYDKIIDAAARHGVYIILTFTDCCCSVDHGDINRYFQVHAPFCNIENKRSTKAFKKRIKEVIERKNSVNGIRYKDDPTILAWDIANELEYWHFFKKDVYDWINKIANYIKSLDSKRLLTIGINASSSDFDKNEHPYDLFDIPALDFFSFHFHPSVETAKANDIKAYGPYIRQMKFRAKKFLEKNKPVVMGEFSFSRLPNLNFTVRSDPKKENFYNRVFEKIMDSGFSSGLSGMVFWGWGVPDEKEIPMWWSKESHSISDESFSEFIAGYDINYK